MVAALKREELNKKGKCLNEIVPNEHNEQKSYLIIELIWLSHLLVKFDYLPDCPLIFKIYKEYEHTWPYLLKQD